MLDSYVSDLNAGLSRIVGAVLILPMDHPIALCVILVGLAGASVAVLFDAMAERP